MKMSMHRPAIGRIRESIAAKQATRPKVDAQGRPLDEPKLYRYDRFGQLVGPVDETDPPAAT